MNNNELINNMSIEEKADFFKNICSQIAIKLDENYIVRDNKYIIKWLEQEAD